MFFCHKYRRPLVTLSLVTALLSVGCQSLTSTVPAQPTTSTPATRSTSTTEAATTPRDTHEHLQGVLWMQTAGEYWASATAAYASAKRAIDLGLKDRKWTAAIEQEGNFGRLPPAVILDLDETVMDNSRFQGRMIRDNKFYDPDIWNTWVDAQSASEIPGAVDFIRYAEGKKVAVFFVTNRTAAQETATIANLARMSLAATPDTVLSNNESGWTSDKSPRRAFLASTHRILALVGDDLNDFVSVNQLSAAQRLEAARKNASRWGSRWFLISNPLYGGFDRSLYPGVTDDATILARKRSLVTAF